MFLFSARHITLTQLHLSTSEHSCSLSLTSRYHYLCERALADSKVPYVVLRPGGLADDARDRETTNVQIDASGKLPVPARIGRDDVASLCVEACTGDVLPADNSFTLACRWCGGGVKPKPQGAKKDGYATAKECLERLIESKATSPPPPARMKPYAAAVGIAAYSFFYLALKSVLALWALVSKLLRG